MKENNIIGKLLYLILSIVWVVVAINLYQKNIENPPIPIISILLGLGTCSFIHLVLGGTNDTYVEYIRNNLRATAYGATATVILISVIIFFAFNHWQKQRIQDYKNREASFITGQEKYEKDIMELEKNTDSLLKKIEYETSSKGRFNWIKSLDPDSVEGSNLIEMVMNREKPFNGMIEARESVTASFINLNEGTFISCSYLKLKNKKILINWITSDGTQKSLNKPLAYAGSITTNFCKENNSNKIDIKLSCDIGKNEFPNLVDNCTYKGNDVGWKEGISPQDKMFQIGYEVVTEN